MNAAGALPCAGSFLYWHYRWGSGVLSLGTAHRFSGRAVRPETMQFYDLTATAPWTRRGERGGFAGQGPMQFGTKEGRRPGHCFALWPGGPSCETLTGKPLQDACVASKIGGP